MLERAEAATATADQATAAEQEQGETEFAGGRREGWRYAAERTLARRAELLARSEPAAPVTTDRTSGGSDL
jgi:hypothetical protein